MSPLVSVRTHILSIFFFLHRCHPSLLALSVPFLYYYFGPKPLGTHCAPCAWPSPLFLNCLMCYDPCSGPRYIHLPQLYIAQCSLAHSSPPTYSLSTRWLTIIFWIPVYWPNPFYLRLFTFFHFFSFSPPLPNSSTTTTLLLVASIWSVIISIPTPPSH